MTAGGLRAHRTAVGFGIFVLAGLAAWLALSDGRPPSPQKPAIRRGPAATAPATEIGPLLREKADGTRADATEASGRTPGADATHSRVREFLDSTESVDVVLGSLNTHYLDRSLLQIIRLATLSSGLTADDVTAALHDTTAGLYPWERNELLLAMAFAADYRPRHDAFLIDRISKAAPTSQANSGSLTEALASAHSLRLRDRLRVATEPINALIDCYTTKRLPMDRNRGLLVDMYLREAAFSETPSRQAVQIASRALMAMCLPEINWHGLARVQMRQDEAGMIAAIHPTTGGWSTCCLAHARQDTSAPRLAQIVEEADSDTMKALGLAGLFGVGSPQSIDQAASLLQKLREPNWTSVQSTWQRLPASRLAAVVCGVAGIENPSAPKVRVARLADTALARTSRIQLSEGERAAVMRSLINCMSSFPTLSGSRFALQIAAEIAGRNDIPDVPSLSYGPETFDDLQAAIAQARNRP